MDKMDGRSMDLVKQNINILEELFQDAFTEGKVDFDKLKLLLGANIDENAEKYELRWNGKTGAIKLSQTPSMGTLRPDKAGSRDWDSTGNLYIEGDNLEVLKLLQKSYFNRIKMIYIDPPYNTGKDFVYKDNFRDNIKNYKEMTNQSMKANTESSGRYHTDWLNMMYPRLKLARNLLSEDGVIFISIDDNEVGNLRKLCDEIFGEDNFVSQIPWKGKGGGADNKYLMVAHEYILLYSRTRESFKVGEQAKEGEVFNKYDAGMNLRYKTQMARKWGSNSRREDRPNLFYEVTAPDGSKCFPMLPDGSDGCWRWSKARMMEEIEQGNVEFVKDGDSWIVYEKIYEPKEGEVNTKKYSTWFDDVGSTATGTKELKAIFDDKVFDFPKPTSLIKELIKIANAGHDDYILDFFSGSATTADAVMQLNAEDGQKRRFIMVQLPEPAGEDSDAYNAGYKNICEIGRERIRRAGEKIKRENSDEEGANSLDTGFKLFKLDDSNIRTWDPGYDELERNLLDMAESLKKGRTNEDLLYEIILKMGFELIIPVETVGAGANTIYNIGEGALIICLDDDITEDALSKIPDLKSEFMRDEDIKVIFKESGFKSDKEKMNAIQNLKQYGIINVRSV